MLDYSDEQIDKLIADIFSGAISVDKLPVDLYKAIAEYLGGALDEIKDTASKSLMKALQKNIFEFSGAKVYSQVQDISLLAENEAIKTFAAFKKEALAIYEQYNKQWLQTEYSTAVAQGQNAVRWEQIQEQKDTLPFLQYSAVVDSQTSEICRPLDGITLPVGHPFWVKNSPLNHWNCFTPETYINCGEGETRIDEITVGTKVLTNKYRLREVTFVHKTEYKGNVLRFLMSGGDWFKCTPNHPLLTTDGWKRAEDVTQADFLISLMGGLKKPKKITAEPYEGLVYNLTVAEDETYVLGIAGHSVIVHNCRCTFKQLDGFDAKVTKASDVKKAGEEIAKEKQPMFNTNSGITKEIFPKDHPYFEAVKDGK